MTKKLRIRFVAVSMALLVLMQMFVIGVTAFRSYYNIVNRADSVIEQIYENKTDDKKLDARYFAVTLDSSGKVCETILIHTMQTSREQAAEYAEKVFTRGTKSGYYEGYRYKLFSQEDGTKRAVFLLRNAYFDVLKNNTVSAAVISTVALVIMFLILIRFSKFVVRPIEMANKKQKEFITTASHELKTPLAVMSADLQMLSDEKGESEWINDLSSQIDRLSKMTGELTELSKIEESETPKILFPVSDFAQEICGDYRAIAQNKNIDFKKEIEPAFDYCGDQNAVCQLFTVLLDNAFKYCPQNGEVTFALKNSGGISVSVSNTVETPLSEEQLLSIFDRFYRAAQTSEKEKGFGIGLSVAKAITEKHKGSIKAEMIGDKTLIITANLR